MAEEIDTEEVQVVTPAGAPPEWYPLSHRERYEKLDAVRQAWCRRSVRELEDRRGRTVELEGSWIRDVPGFHLALGEAIQGPGGYFGGDLDALSDCLCGGFGVLPPLTIRLSDFEEVRKALDGRAWCRFRAEGFRQAVAEGESQEALVEWCYLGDGSEAEAARWTSRYAAALAGEEFDADEFGSYFEALVKVLEERGAKIVPAI